MVLFSRGAARLRAFLARSKSQVACACRFEPTTTGCANCSQENAIAMGTPQNCSHWSRIQAQIAHGCRRVACRALNLCGRYLGYEDLLKETCGNHDAYSPVGPKRSVLIVRGSCPSSTRSLEAVSTKGVGPQRKTFGFCPGEKQASASSDLSILRRWPTHPLGCLRVSVLTTRKAGSC